MDGEEGRVAFVAPSPQFRGGIAQFAANMASAVGGSHEILFLCFSRLYPSWTRAARQGGPDTSSGAFDLASIPMLVPWLPWTWVRALRRIDRFRPRLLVMQWWHPAFGPCLGFLARGARRLGISVAFVCHNARPHEGFPLWKTLTRRALRRADVLFALSGSVEADLAWLVPGVPVQVVGHPPNLRPGPAVSGASASGASGVPHGVRNPWADRIGPVDGPIILFFGYVRAYKGLQDLIAAMPEVRARVPATLVVTGPFLEPAARFRRQAESLGVADAVRLFPQYVPNDEVGQLFGAADVLALPYRSASQSGIVPLAASFGLPVVATAAGGIPEALGDRGVIVAPNDRQALADGLVSALREPPSPPALDRASWSDWASEIDRLAGAAPVRAGSPRSSLIAAARIFAWSVVVFFVTRVFFEGLRGLHGAHLSFGLAPLIASSLLLVVARVTDVVAWHVLVRGTGARVPIRTTARIFTTAEMVRFLPGGVLHLAARYRFAAKAGVPPQSVVTTTVLDLGLRIVGGLVLFLASVPMWPSVPHAAAWLPVLAVPVFLVLLHPKILGWIVTRVSRMLGRRWGAVSMPFPPLVLAGGFTAVGWILRGLAAYLVARALVALPLGLLMPVAGAIALSWVAGVLTPFAPGGLGVREAAGASLLARFMPLPGAIVLMLLSRIQYILIELGTTALAVAWDVRAARRSPDQARRAEATVGANGSRASTATAPRGREWTP